MLRYRERMSRPGGGMGATPKVISRPRDVAEARRPSGVPSVEPELEMPSPCKAMPSW